MIQSETSKVDLQTHRLRRAPRRNCGPCSSSRCTWHIAPPASLPGSSGIPAQTRNGLIKLTVIKNRSKGEEQGGDGSDSPARGGGGGGGPTRSIASLFMARRAFPKALWVNRGKIICGLWQKKSSHSEPPRARGRGEVRIFV